MNILLTGGAGYIGSHTCAELLEAGHSVVVADNFANSFPEAIEGIFEAAGRRPKVYEADLLDPAAAERIFSENEIDAVIHFAGLKAVGESVAKPLLYYRVNLGITQNLLEAMERRGARNLIFSSSATVYGLPERVPIAEDAPVSAINPYGQTKVIQEQILRDLAASTSGSGWKVVLLRYFNPVGAHPSGLIGEQPKGAANNLFPAIGEVAAGTRPALQIFGDDYDTADGTAVRDYIHVRDLARGHRLALEKLWGSGAAGGVWTYNLGTGRGYSVREVLQAFEAAHGRSIPCIVEPRRAGDAAACYADPALAARELGFSCEFDLEQMCADAYRWAVRGKA